MLTCSSFAKKKRKDFVAFETLLNIIVLSEVPLLQIVCALLLKNPPKKPTNNVKCSYLPDASKNGKCLAVCSARQTSAFSSFAVSSPLPESCHRHHHMCAQAIVLNQRVKLFISHIIVNSVFIYNFLKKARNKRGPIYLFIFFLKLSILVVGRRTIRNPSNVISGHLIKRVAPLSSEAKC